MLAEFAVMQHEWRRQGCSDFKLLLRLLPSSFDFVGGVIRLAWARLMRAASTLIYSFEQLMLLQHPVNEVESIHDAPGLVILALRGLHQMTGSAGRRASHVLLRLSPTAAVTSWDSDAEALFGFSYEEILGQQAVTTFVPEVETGGRKMPELLLKVCTAPHQYNLNFNENQDRQGNRFWMLWVNVPEYDVNGELTGTVSLGIKVQDPEVMKVLIDLWQWWKSA
jgi:PAS domain S-box-containing protein